MGAEARTALFDLGAHNPSFDALRRAAPAIRAPIDFCVPVNRHFPPPELLEDIRAELPRLLRHYPDYADVHQRAVARIAGVPAENVVVANGSTELITLLCERCRGPIATPVPTFGRWTDLPIANGTPVSFLQRRPERGFALGVDEIVEHVRRHGIRTIVLCNPNNPTGALLDAGDVRRLVDALADLDLVILDESFLDFAGIESAAALAVERPNLVIVKSLGKSIGWHGVRLGYAVAREDRAGEMRARVPYWNVNGLAAFVLGRVAELVPELAASFDRVRADRDAMVRALHGVRNLRTFPSHANYVCVELPRDVSGRALRDALLDEHGLLVRECGNKLGSSERYLRLAVNLPPENARLVAALASLPEREPGPAPVDAPTIRL